MRVSVPLFAKTKPAAWRNICGCTLKPILAAMPARSTSLARPATVNGAPLSETKVKADFGLALQCPGAPQIHPRASRKLTSVTICREFRHSDQTIKSEHVGTDRRRMRPARLTYPFFRANPPPPVQLGEGSQRIEGAAIVGYARQKNERAGVWDSARSISVTRPATVKRCERRLGRAL